MLASEGRSTQDDHEILASVAQSGEGWGARYVGVTVAQTLASRLKQDLGASRADSRLLRFRKLVGTAHCSKTQFSLTFPLLSQLPRLKWKTYLLPTLSITPSHDGTADSAELFVQDDNAIARVESCLCLCLKHAAQEAQQATIICLNSAMYGGREVGRYARPAYLQALRARIDGVEAQLVAPGTQEPLPEVNVAEEVQRAQNRMRYTLGLFQRSSLPLGTVARPSALDEAGINASAGLVCMGERGFYKLHIAKDITLSDCLGKTTFFGPVAGSGPAVLRRSVDWSQNREDAQGTTDVQEIAVRTAAWSISGQCRRVTPSSRSRRQHRHCGAKWLAVWRTPNATRSSAARAPLEASLQHRSVRLSPSPYVARMCQRDLTDVYRYDFLQDADKLDIVSVEIEGEHYYSLAMSSPHAGVVKYDPAVRLQYLELLDLPSLKTRLCEIVCAAARGTDFRIFRLMQDVEELCVHTGLDRALETIKRRLILKNTTLCKKRQTCREVHRTPNTQEGSSRASPALLRGLARVNELRDRTDGFRASPRVLQDIVDRVEQRLQEQGRSEERHSLLAKANAASERRQLRLSDQPTSQQLEAVYLAAYHLVRSEDQVSGNLTQFMARHRFSADLDAYCVAIFAKRWQDVARGCLAIEQYDELTLMISSYILTRLQETRGHAGIGRPLAKSVLGWVQNFLWACVEEFRAERESLRRLLTGPSYDRGIIYQLHAYVRQLAHEYGLPRMTDRVRNFWGKLEAALICQTVEGRLMTSSLYGVEAKTQTINMVKVFLLTGVRPSSLGIQDYEDEATNALPIHCLSIEQRTRFNWTIMLDITTLKGHRDALADVAQQTFTIHQVTKKADILLDLSTTLIPALVHRGIVYDPLHGVMVSSVKQFVESKSARFELRSFTEQGLFLASNAGHSGLTGRCVRASALTDTVGEAAREAHLDFTGVYAFRHDFGNTIYDKYGERVAQTALHHQAASRSNVLIRHYTRGSASLDVTHIRITDADRALNDGLPSISQCQRSAINALAIEICLARKPCSLFDNI